MKIIILFFCLGIFSSYGYESYFSTEFGISTPKDASVGLTGYTDSTTSYDSALGFGLSSGIKFSNNSKLEVKFTTQENEGTIMQIDSSLVAVGLTPKIDLKVNTLGLNLIHEEEVDGISQCKVSLNAGLGIAFAEVETSLVKLEDSVFYFNTGGGINYSLDESISIYLKYNYFFMGDAEEGYTLNAQQLGLGLVDIYTKSELGAHQFMTGISIDL